MLILLTILDTKERGVKKDGVHTHPSILCGNRKIRGSKEIRGVRGERESRF